MLKKDKRFSKLVEVLEKNRGLRDDLDRKDAKVTFFAPTNDAMDKLKEDMEKAARGGHRPEMDEVPVPVQTEQEGTSAA